MTKEYRTPKFSADVVETENGYRITDKTFQPYKTWNCDNSAQVVATMHERMTNYDQQQADTEPEAELE